MPTTIMQYSPTVFCPGVYPRCWLLCFSVGGLQSSVVLFSVFCPLSSVLAPLHLSRTLYKSTLFMQNKPNFQKSQMNVNPDNRTDYENIANWTLGENKPNSKPICQRAKLMQSVYLQRIMKKNAAKGYEKTNPKQTLS